MPGGSDGKESTYNAGDPGLIPRSGGSPGEGNGYPFQYSCLENSVDRRAWQATIHRSQRVNHDRVTNFIAYINAILSHFSRVRLCATP